MSKRTDTIRTLFARSAGGGELSVDNRPGEGVRVPSGAVKSIKETFSAVERENDHLRALLADATQIREVAPEDIDPSPFADRFTQDDDASFSLLKQSIGERGQEIPVLLRPHASRAGRFEIAYGHRRVRAARELSRPVRAIVRPLSDDDLVISQGLENSAREDLSFIERATFARQIEDSGRSRSVIQQALAVDKAEVSKLIAVARAIPQDVVRAIGRAARTGRPRWQDLAAALKDGPALKRVRRAIAAETFPAIAPDERFAAVFAAAMHRDRSASASPPALPVTARDGAALGKVLASRREIRVALSKHNGPAFAAFLAKRLPDLLQEFDEAEIPSSQTADRH